MNRNTATIEMNYIRLVNPVTGRFVGEYDPARRVLLVVDRGGTAFIDLARLEQEYKAQTGGANGKESDSGETVSG